MPKKSTSLATILLFCGALAAMLIRFLLSPPREFSPHENRYLAQRPEFSADALFSGKLSRAYEDYLSDQFPLRDKWIVLQAAMQRGTGRLENNDVYFGRQLIRTFWQYDEENLARNFKAIEGFAAQADFPVYAVPVPNACEICRGMLPASAPDRSQAEILADASALMQSAQLVDTRQALLAAADTPLYYATDHHMTSAGAYRVYAALADAMGLSPLPESAYTKTAVSTAFTGTLYRRSGAWWTSPDTIERWDAPGVSASLEVLPAGTQHSTIYDDTALSGADQYAYFAYGNQPLEVIRTNAEGGRLLLIKDSYAHAVLPFLCAHFSEIHMVDLRYYRSSMQQYLRENEFDSAAVLYNISNLAEDTNLPQLLR